MSNISPPLLEVENLRDAGYSFGLSDHPRDRVGCGRAGKALAQPGSWDPASGI